MVSKTVEISGQQKVEKNSLLSKISFTDGLFLTKYKTLDTKKKISIFSERGLKHGQSTACDIY